MRKLKYIGDRIRFYYKLCKIKSTVIKTQDG